MREKSDITDLFRNRLSEAKMNVRKDFWEELNASMQQYADVPTKNDCKRVGIGAHWRIGALTPRVAAAAVVALMLGAASAAFWYFSPKEEIKEAFTQVATLNPEGSLKGDMPQETLPAIHQAEKVAHQNTVTASPCSMVAVNEEDDEETMSVHVSITITQRVTGNGYYGDGIPTSNRNYHSASDVRKEVTDKEETAQQPLAQPKPRNWALKAGVGTSLPKGDCDMPFTAAVSVERRLGKCLSVEAGLRYNCLSGKPTLHTLEVPVRVNMLLASSNKVDFYALAGGAAEKCVAGAKDNGFDAEPVQLSVAAGLGVRYKLSDRLSLFAEPTLSHHFDTDSRTQSLRNERATNFNLLCGVRMTY